MLVLTKISFWQEDWVLGYYSMEFRHFPDIFLSLVVRQLMRPFLYTMFLSNNRASFHLWWKENLLKHQKVSEYCESGCRLHVFIFWECCCLLDFYKMFMKLSNLLCMNFEILKTSDLYRFKVFSEQESSTLRSKCIISFITRIGSFSRVLIKSYWTCEEPELRFCWMKWSNNNNDQSSKGRLMSLANMIGARWFIEFGK